MNCNDLNTIDNDRRFFTLCCVVFTQEQLNEAKYLINDLKNKYWADGMFEYKNGDRKKVCRHTSDINKKVGCFSPDKINYQDFISDLSECLAKIECTVIAITLDLIECVKNGHIDDVYELAFNSIMERFVYFSEDNSRSTIFFESRGKTEDKQLLRNIKKTIFADGLNHISCNELQDKIEGVYFNKKWRDDTYTYIGLEIADLFAYPIHKFQTENKYRKDFEIVESKIYGYPNRIKFGLMKYPKK